MATKRPVRNSESVDTFDIDGKLDLDGGFESKLWRLMLANKKAAEEIKKIKPPKTDKELRAKMKNVATAVGRALNTAPTVALSAYIDPTVWKKWKTATRRSRKPPGWSATVTKARKIESLLAERFRARWKGVETDFANGIDVAKERAQFFMGRDSRTELRIARRYYNPPRAGRFANASNSEIVELCWAWFNPFQVFAHRSGNDLAEIADQLEELIGSEYVAMTWGLFQNSPGYTESSVELDPGDPDPELFHCDPPQVYPLPDLFTECGDVYEAIVYSFFGSRLRVCKSIVEPFLDGERVDAMNDIEERFIRNAIEEDDDPRTWRVHFRCLTSFLIPIYGRALIEADIFGQVGSEEQKDSLRTLKEELKANGNGYLKRPRAGW